MSIARWISEAPRPNRIAFTDEGREVTYRQFAARINAVAATLAAAGVNPGDRVGFCGLNRIELFETFFACARLRAIFVPYNNRLTPTELGVQIADSDPAILFATDGFAERMRLASPDHVVRDLDDEPVRSEGIEAIQLREDRDIVDDTVLMVYTSGTTGNAKGALLSHDAILHTVLNGIDHQKITADDRTLAVLPTFHVGGLNIQVLPTLFAGGHVLLPNRFDPGLVLDLIGAHQVTQTCLVPAMLAAISGHPDFQDTDISSLRGINSGSSVVPADVMQPFFERGVPVGQVYGLTETGPTAIVLGFDEAATHIGTCGRPATHTELRIVDPEERDVEAGEPGELLVRGRNLFHGYWNNPAATVEAFVDGDWFRTGDIGYQDEDGYITISDRIKDVVISGGENVYPAELEPILLRHPSIVEVAVIGQPDERWGEVPVAVVVLADGAQLTIEELRTWCDGQFARFKHPRVLRAVDSLPRTALGKVQKHQLRDG